MSAQATKQSAEANETCVKELIRENELLFKQLHIVQEELERYYCKLREYEQGKGSTHVPAAVIFQDPDLLAENLRLRAMVAQQQSALQVEMTNSLAVRLGEMFIKGVSATGSLITLPVRLCRMWKALNRTVPPDVLGGKNFQKVQDAYAVGGRDAVERLLDSVFLSPVMRADAYTAVARQAKLTDTRGAAEFARLAWETDPRPYRLKWLAFRLYEADDIINAEALLDMLPSDINTSDSEKRQAARLREEAQRRRIQQAQKLINSSQAENKQPAITVETKQSAEECNHELTRINQQLIELKKVESQARQEATQAIEAQGIMQRQLEAQKCQYEALAKQTALMLKRMLTQFEQDATGLSRILSVIMSTEKSK